MVTTFTPCMNYITGSTANGRSSPSMDCCDALKSVMSSSMDCACVMLTGGVPLPQIVNATLALGLPRICSNVGVPLQCKGSAVPLPAPGPLQFGVPPPPSSALSPQASQTLAPTPGPVQFDTTPPPNSELSPQASKATAFTPGSEPAALEQPPVVPPSTIEAEAPSRISRFRPVTIPSSASSASIISLTTTSVWAFYMLVKL
ncbi:unnamed protein product [Amaranthus hypochondriacus]